MTVPVWLALTWLALGSAVLLVPLPAVAGRRVVALARRGRLGAVRGPGRRVPRAPPVSALAPLWCVACAVAAGVLGGVALALAAAVAAATLAAVTSSALASRRDARRRRELLTAIRLVVAELEAGSRPASALSAAGEVAPDHVVVLTAAAQVAAAGGDVAETLLCTGPADLVPLAHAWRVGALAGAPMADVLSRVAADLTDLERQHQAVAVALAGPRSSAMLLAGLPVVGIALGAAMGARPLEFLLATPSGRLLCCLGVLLDAAGVIWTQRLMQRAQRA